MIKINLLPYKEAKRKELLMQVAINAFLLFLVLILAISVLEVNYMSDKKEIENEIISTQREIDRLKEIIAQVKKFERDKKGLEQKLAIMAKLQENRAGPVRFLDDLSMSTPEKLWVSSFEEMETTIQIPSSNPKEPPKTKTVHSININGAAVSFKAIADFMSGMERSKSFSDIELQVIEQFTEKKFNLLKFSIICELESRKG